MGQLYDCDPIAFRSLPDDFHHIRHLAWLLVGPFEGCNAVVGEDDAGVGEVRRSLVEAHTQQLVGHCPVAASVVDQVVT